MGKSGININLDLDSVKLDKLHRDAVINDGINIQRPTSPDVTKNYGAGETNTYGGVSSSEVETMDLSSSTADTSGTNSSINTDPSSMTDSSGSNINEVSSVSEEHTNTNISSSSSATNNSTNGGSVESYNTSSNKGVNSSSSTNDLGMGNLSSNSNDPNENKDLDIRDKKNKPSIDSNESSTSTRGSSTNLNVNSSQSTQSDSQGSNSTSKLGASFDMPEDSTENVVEEASTSGDTITITTLDANGNEVTVEVSVDEYTNLLSSFGIITEDINRVLNGSITLENLVDEIQADTDNTRREKMLYATNLQAYGLEYTDIKELEKDITTQKQKLKELYDQRLKADNHEIDAVANFLYRLQNGENLESILTSQIVAWEYVDENGNKKYRYDDPYAAGYMDGITYTPYTFEEMYKDSTVLKELKEHLTEQTYKPLFSDEEKTVHVWDGSAEQQEYFDKLLEDYGSNYDDREEVITKLDAEISELEEKVNIYDSIYNAIVEEVDYYLYNIDAYLHKEDFYENNSFNESALDAIDKLKKANENIYVAPDSPTLPAIYITDKEDLVNILSCIINGEGNISNGYLQVGQNMFNLSSTDNILSDYLKYLPYIDEDTKDVFNYIYNTEGIDEAYDFLNGDVYDELDKKWLTETTLINEDFAREHPVVSSVGSIVVTPFEGLSAFYYSMSSYLTNQKIRRANVFSAGDVWRSTVAQDIAKNSEVLSFIYSTGMSMADSVALIGLTAATGGVGSAAISAATMGSRAYVSTLNEALDRGLSDGEAIALSFSSAVVETAMENYSVSHLLNLEEKLGDGVIKLTSKIADKIENKTIANIVSKGFYVGASAVSQGFVEGEEESATELLNYVADIFIAKDLSNYTQTLKAYMDDGYDETAAWINTMKDFSAQAIQAFAGGFASGICFGAFGGVRTVQRSSYAIANDMYGKLNGKSKAQKFAQVLEINRNQLQEFNDIAEKKQKGETLTAAEEFFLSHGTIEMQIAENMKYAREAKIRGLLKSIREITQTKGANTGKPVDVNGIENFDAAARDFAEGNKVLEELLLTSHKYNVDTIACCGGHIGYTKLDPNSKYYQPYIAYKMTTEFERCLPTILEVMGNDNFDITFIKNTLDSGYNSFVVFKQNNYGDEMFTTLNSVIENVMGNEAYITNVSENTNKIMELYNYLRGNELTTSVQVEISKNISGVNSVIDYEMYYGTTCNKGSFDAQNFVEGLSEVEGIVKSIDTKASATQLEAKVEGPTPSSRGIFSREFNEAETYQAYKTENIYKSTFDNLLEVLNEIKTKNTGERILVEVPNTVGLTSEIIEAIPENVDVRIIGGLTTEYAKSHKYSSMERLREKATYSKEELQLILNKFNEIEKNINPNWNAYEKALYLYEYLVNNMVYRKTDGLDNRGNAYRTRTWDTLTGLIHQVSLCSGFAHIYQELCTRQGIDCVKVGGKYLDGKEGAHAWNLVTIEGNTFLVDAIWDAQDREKGIYHVSDFGNPDLSLYAPRSYREAHKNLTTIDSEWIEATLKDFEGLIPRITNENEIIEKWQKTIEEDRKRMEYLINPVEINANNSAQSSYENRLVSAINSGEGVIDIIKEINTYMNDNFPEGYSNIFEFKESIADALIKTGTLDKLTNQQFYELIKSNIILRKVIDSERLTNFVRETLDVSPRKTMQLFSDLTDEELIKIFDKEQIKDYLNGLNDNSFTKICETIINNKREAILVKSTNLIDRLFNVDSVKLSGIISKMDVTKILVSDVSNGVVFLDKIMEVYDNEETIFKSPSLAHILRFYIPYRSEYSNYMSEMEKLDDLIKETARNKLVENATVPVASDAVIKGDKLSCYDVKYLVDGVEYTREIATDGLGEFDLADWYEQYTNILEGKLKITSITENKVKSTLRNITAEVEDGLNVVTLEIDGKVEKYLSPFFMGRTSLINLTNNREINEVKILSVDPYIKSTYDFKTDDKGTAYKITYKIDEKSYEAYLPVVSNEVKIDEFFVKNNLYNATDINIEAFKVSDISPESISYKRYANSGEIFSDSYFGGDQSDVRKIVVAALENETLSEVNRQKSEVLIGLIKEYYPDASDTDIKNIVKAYENNGCFYMATANAFITYMNSIPNGATIFKDRMGFDLAIADGSSKSFNLEAVALEYYLYTHKNFKNCDSVETLLDNTSGLNLETHEKAAPSYFESKGINVEMLSINPENMSFKDQLLVQSLNMDAIWVVTNEGFDLEGFKNVDIDGEDGSVVDAEVNGNVIKNVGAHAMLITDIDSDGNIIVSSWSGKYKFLPKSTASMAINGMKFNVSGIKTDVVGERLVNALNSGEGVNDIILEIKYYTEENIPEGYSSLSEFKENLADILIETGTLDKLDNQQFAVLIKDKAFLRKVLDSDKLSYFIRKNLAGLPKKVINLFDGLTNEELIKIFDREDIGEYLDTLDDSQFLEICDALDNKDSNIPIISNNFMNRITKLSPESFAKYMSRTFSLYTLLSNDTENGVKFLEKIKEVYGTEEIILLKPTLAQDIISKIPYTPDEVYESYKEFFKNLGNNVRKKLCDNLIANSEIEISSDGTIEGNGYYIIKYAIDGVEYELKPFGIIYDKLDLLEELKARHSDILAGKLKLISVEKDTIKNSLCFEGDYDGLNVITLEINGQLEKHVVDFVASKASLTKLMSEKQIDSVKLVSIEPFIQSSFNIKDVDNDTVYMMTYTVDGEEFSHSFLPSRGKVYIDSYFTINNLYNATDINFEAIKISDISKEKFKINGYNNSEELFQSGAYGGNQGDVEDIVVQALAGEELSNIDKQKSVLLIELIKKYYPDASDTDVKNIAKAYAERGCAYMAVANSFITYMNSISNGATVFKDKMGFDLAVYDGIKKSFNVEAVALEYYLYTHKFTRGFDTIESLLANSNGLGRLDYEETVSKFFESKNVAIECDCSGLDKASYIQELLVNSLNHGGFFILGSSGFNLEKLDAGTLSKSDKALSNVKIRDNILEDIDGHAMLITDMLENGDLIVSSWKGKYKFIKAPTTERVSVYNIKFNVGSVEIEQLGDNLIKAVETDTGVDEAISEIDSYTEENVLEGYSSIMEFKEYLLNKLREKGILSKLSKLQIVNLLRGKKERIKTLRNNLVDRLGTENLKVDRLENFDSTEIILIPIDKLLEVANNKRKLNNVLNPKNSTKLFDGYSQSQMIDGLAQLIMAARKNNYVLGISSANVNRILAYINKSPALLGKTLGFTSEIDVNNKNNGLDATMRSISISTLLDILTNDESYLKFLELGTNPMAFNGLTQIEIADGISKLMTAAKKNNYDLGLDMHGLARADYIVNRYGYDALTFARKSIGTYIREMETGRFDIQRYLGDVNFLTLLSDEVLNMTEVDEELHDKLMTLKWTALYEAKNLIENNINVGEANIENLLSFVMSFYDLNAMSANETFNLGYYFLSYLDDTGNSQYRRYLNSLGNNPNWIDTVEPGYLGLRINDWIDKCDKAQSIIDLVNDPVIPKLLDAKMAPTLKFASTEDLQKYYDFLSKVAKLCEVTLDTDENISTENLTHIADFIYTIYKYERLAPEIFNKFDKYLTDHNHNRIKLYINDIIEDGEVSNIYKKMMVTSFLKSDEFVIKLVNAVAPYLDANTALERIKKVRIEVLNSSEFLKRFPDSKDALGLNGHDTQDYVALKLSANTKREDIIGTSIHEFIHQLARRDEKNTGIDSYKMRGLNEAITEYLAKKYSTSIFGLKKSGSGYDKGVEYLTKFINAGILDEEALLNSYFSNNTEFILKKLKENSRFNLNIWDEFIFYMQLATGHTGFGYKYDYKLKNITRGCRNLTRILAELSGGVPNVK